MGTTDISILNIADGVFEVLGTAGDTHLGGEDIDNILIQHCLLEFQKKNANIKIKDEKRLRNRLKIACETAKRTLSSTTTATIIVDSIEEYVVETIVEETHFQETCQKCVSITTMVTMANPEII